MPMISPRKGAWRSSHPTTNRPTGSATKRHLIQTDLKGRRLPASESEAVGHNFPTKPSSTSSIVTFQNIGPSVTGCKNIAPNPRSPSLCHSRVLFLDHTLNVPSTEFLPLLLTRLQESNPCAHTYLSYNTNAPSVLDLFEGTGLSIHRSLHSRKLSSGADPTRLGRWTFIRLRGKCSSSISFFSAY